MTNPKSLLIPTESDYIDAHGDTKPEEQFRETWNKLRLEKDANGNYKYPWDFEVVQGFFKQSDDSTDDRVFNYALDHMGRLKSWKEIVSDLEKLNSEAPDNVEYKLLILARHGEGWHNRVVNKHGLEAWDNKYHALTTDGEITYAPDPELTDIGIKQAQENRDLWKKEIELGAPIPSKFFVSPLQRSSNTLVITWQDLKPKDKQPIVVEKIRETIGKNLCDKRSSKTIIDQRFGKYGFKTDGIVEEDIYFGDERESMTHQSMRINEFLQDLFESDCKNGKVDKNLAKENIAISTTSHAGTIRCFINVLNHRKFTISTGGMIPIVCRGTRRQ
ncbi:unnamed protein product [Candida verbasci]|uniref:Uncharacterized protein n=1 Tax=Candida verbasci TaxID=1227364 RepID=A0A9W4TSI5_9ASCO|nr:unnamed protein product [Candida verbasci]